MSTKENNYCLSFLTVSFYYLHTAENILEQMIKSGNIHMYFEDYGNESDIQKEYDKKTKWSDFNVMIPMLFVFYHGIETLLKGLLFLKNPNSDSIIKHGHNLINLFSETQYHYPDLSFIKFLEKYLICSKKTPAVLRDFIDSNKDIRDMNDLYSILRYPTDITKKINYNYFKLKYREEEGLLFAQELKELIGKIRIETVGKYRNNKK